jgi:hypothetical protein
VLSSESSDGDRAKRPFYQFQLVPSEDNLARVFYSVTKEYAWRRVALIIQNGHQFKTV